MIDMPDIIHYLAKRYGNHHTVYIIGKTKIGYGKTLFLIVY
ncbi:hypothetical protein BPSOL_0037 [Bifidobacterium pseudolongum]|nr:hypothetical protein BPSOL_0037 [Bifidobacterium pseudolongum]